MKMTQEPELELNEPSNPIVVKPAAPLATNGFRIEYPAFDIDAKELALSNAAEIVKVTTDEEEKIALDALRVVQHIITLAEKARKVSKGPLDMAAAKIQSMHKAYVLEPEAAKERLGSLIKPHVQKRLDAAAALERKRLADMVESARLASEAQEKADKAARDLANATTAKAKAAAEKALAKATATVEAKHDEIRASAPVTAAAMDGASATPKWKYTVTDIKALYAARPDLCELSEVRSRVNVAIALNQTIPGLLIERDITLITR